MMLQWLRLTIMWHTLMVKVARSNEGFVDLMFLRGGALSVPVTTEALPRTWMPARIALAKVEVGLMAAVLNMFGIILEVLVEVVGGVGNSWYSLVVGTFGSVHGCLPEVVADVVCV